MQILAAVVLPAVTAPSRPMTRSLRQSHPSAWCSHRCAATPFAASSDRQGEAAVGLSVERSLPLLCRHRAISPRFRRLFFRNGLASVFCPSRANAPMTSPEVVRHDRCDAPPVPIGWVEHGGKSWHRAVAPPARVAETRTQNALHHRGLGRANPSAPLCPILKCGSGDRFSGEYIHNLSRGHNC